MLQGKSQTNTNDIELLSNVKKGCLANTPYSELHVKTMMKMAVKNSMEIKLKFGDSTFILAQVWQFECNGHACMAKRNDDDYCVKYGKCIL